MDLHIQTTYAHCPNCGEQYPAQTIHGCATVRMTLASHPGVAWIVPNGTPIHELNQIAGAFLHFTASVITAHQRS